MTSQEPFELPLFPLQTVLFPGGQLSLKVFEARYLDLMGRCMRENGSFGVVCLRQGTEVKLDGEPVQFESCAVLARLADVDAAQVGILKVRCIGTTRVRLSQPRQQSDGLWLADAQTLPDDEPEPPAPDVMATVTALSNAIDTLRQQGSEPFAKPFRLDNAGWVANRWCEILPISLAAKQKLMELDDPTVRLQLVDEFLRSKGVV
jgi:uncharacterized protein